jgi:hypothetical protein
MKLLLLIGKRCPGYPQALEIIPLRCSCREHSSDHLADMPIGDRMIGTTARCTRPERRFWMKRWVRWVSRLAVAPVAASVAVLSWSSPASADLGYQAVRTSTLASVGGEGGGRTDVPGLEAVRAERHPSGERVVLAEAAGDELDGGRPLRQASGGGRGPLAVDRNAG